MKLRSLLFVPGDSERKFAKAQASGADALILDLEDSVAPGQKVAARAHVARLLDKTEPCGWSFFVRINALDTGLTLDDLAAVVKPGLDGVLIPKANGAEDIVRFSHYLDAFETKAGMPVGSIRIVVVATETAKAMFALHTYAPAHPRLAALTWGGEDLAAALGATENREAGGWTFPYQVVRAQCLFAAAAAEVTPSTRSTPTSATRKGSNSTAAVRVATGSSAAWRSIPTRSRSLTAATRRPKRRSPMRAGSWRPSLPIPARARSESRARWSTSRI